MLKKFWLRNFNDTGVYRSKDSINTKVKADVITPLDRIFHSMEVLKSDEVCCHLYLDEVPAAIKYIIKDSVQALENAAIINKNGGKYARQLFKHKLVLQALKILKEQTALLEDSKKGDLDMDEKLNMISKYADFTKAIAERYIVNKR